MIFSDNFHIGTMICNFGSLENLITLESLVNLFNMSIVELVETQIKDRIIYFNMISNKDLNFNNYLNKKMTKNSSGIINSTVRNILNAKLSKFKNSKRLSNSDDINKSLVKLTENTKEISIPNINFDKKAVFKKTFTNFLKMAEELKDGEIIYKI